MPTPTVEPVRRAPTRTARATVAILGTLLLAILAIAPASGQQSAAVTVDRDSSSQPFSYEPPAITVDPGATVTWSNPRLHTAGQAEDHPTNCRQGQSKGTCPWSSKPLPPGGSFSVTFPDEGTFFYFCAVHPYMEGRVVVGDGTPPAATPSPEASPEPSPEPTTSSEPSAPSSSPPATPAASPSASATPSPDASATTDEAAAPTTSTSPSDEATADDAASDEDLDADDPDDEQDSESEDGDAEDDGLLDDADEVGTRVPRVVATILVLGVGAAALAVWRRR